MVATHCLTAQRFAGKPLRQPNYSMRDVPRCDKLLTGSTIGEVSNRDHFNDAMAEMVLLCNEVMRRKSQSQQQDPAEKKSRGGTEEGTKSKSSKPLSLEYLADRCDVDDPIWGFIVRSDTPPPTPLTTPTSRSGNTHHHDIQLQNERFQKGMMQGFITVTTFTNWQTSFRWDSMHDSAFSYDDPDMAKAMADKCRQFDENGSLAAEIQNTVRCGDPWNEGIVWPRVAEISLLGALGCGKALLSLAIERLESMQANNRHNYDYVVLQATNNSIPFYESMGFVRVGAVTTANNNQNSNKENEVRDMSSVIASGPARRIKTNSRGTLRKICKELNVDVWDVTFLNKDLYPNISQKSVIQTDTELFIPDTSKLDGNSNATDAISLKSDPSVTKWYDAKDNETPREIAKTFNVCLKQLLMANKGRIQGLQGHSKLVEDTRIQVSNLDVHYDEHVPYCHWTFPDDKFENNEPSYMMARKLNRKGRQASKEKPMENSLAVEITKYEPPISSQIDLNTPVKSKATKSPYKPPKKSSKKRKLHPDQPNRPKKPKTGYFFFLDSERKKMKDSDAKQKTVDFIRAASGRWNELSATEKNIFKIKREEASIEYEIAMKKYNEQMEKFKAEHPDWEQDNIDQSAEKVKVKKEKHLFNKVVRLTEEGQREAGSEYEYYYVLTYIPDLFWCHLAPMKQKGTFGVKLPKVQGRTKWVLVGEEEGKELDISAAVCEVVRSRCMKRCADADKEEWDISDPVNEKSPNTNTPTSNVSIVSASSVKDTSEESDNEITPSSKVKKGLIKANTMYSRLLKMVE